MKRLSAASKAFFTILFNKPPYFYMDKDGSSCNLSVNEMFEVVKYATDKIEDTLHGQRLLNQAKEILEEV